MSQLYVLYEHAAGFGLFRTTEFEEVAVFIPQVRESILNISKFRSNVFFVAFHYFDEQKNALHNMKSVAKDSLSKDLQLFLENNVPRTKKSKQAVILGVIEPALASVISDKLGIKCISSGVVVEVTRGIRFHFEKLIKGFQHDNYAVKTQLALGHNYCREKLNFDTERQDSMIMESNSLIDELEKDIKTLGKRIKCWYSCHFPELNTVVHDNVEMYVQCVNCIGDRKNMPENIEEELNAILGESSEIKASLILTAAHSSMGMDISSVDLENLKMMCVRVISLINRRQCTIQYLKSKMQLTAPNISALVGEMIGCKLICRAGGLEKLAKLPASTVQVLGAGKNYFRSIKNRDVISGLLSASTHIKKSTKKRKSHVARFLSNKCSLAARIDCYRKVGKSSFGKQLVQEVENFVNDGKKS